TAKTFSTPATTTPPHSTPTASAATNPPAPQRGRGPPLVPKEDTMTTICTPCATALTNADDSVWEDHTPEERASIDASVDALGEVTLVPHNFSEYFGCCECNQTDHHDGYTTAN